MVQILAHSQARIGVGVQELVPLHLGMHQAVSHHHLHTWARLISGCDILLLVSPEQFLPHQIPWFSLHMCSGPECLCFPGVPHEHLNTVLCMAEVLFQLSLGDLTSTSVFSTRACFHSTGIFCWSCYPCYVQVQSAQNILQLTASEEALEIRSNSVSSSTGGMGFY
jgi:hypothetical protein